MYFYRSQLVGHTEREYRPVSLPHPYAPLVRSTRSWSGRR
jgi:hypothetical protein